MNPIIICCDDYLLEDQQREDLSLSLSHRYYFPVNGPKKLQDRHGKNCLVYKFELTVFPAFIQMNPILFLCDDYLLEDRQNEDKKSLLFCSLMMTMMIGFGWKG